LRAIVSGPIRSNARLAAAHTGGGKDGFLLALVSCGDSSLFRGRLALGLDRNWLD
jgi:hypothetical protein